jgi:septum formation protein
VTPPPLILASASPRRADLLRAAGIPFAVRIADVDETPRLNESAHAYVRRLAVDKARAVAVSHPTSAVLGADTVVVVDGQILGKPVDGADAARMLQMLSGRRHEVLTGVCLIQPPHGCAAEVGSVGASVAAGVSVPHGVPEAGAVDPRVEPESEPEYVRVAVTGVEFGHLSTEEISSYVASGEPMDKAGAYAIQGLASRFVVAIEGSYTNVVGLPVALVYALCRAAGIQVS